MNAVTFDFEKTQKEMNPWLIDNKAFIEEISIYKPMSWLEQDCFSNCD